MGAGGWQVLFNRERCPENGVSCPVSDILGFYTEEF